MRPRDLGSSTVDDAAAFERMFGDDTPSIAELLIPNAREAWESDGGD